MRNFIFLLFSISFLFFSGCGFPSKNVDIHYTNNEEIRIPEGVNIVWIVAEDLSPVIPPFGDSTIQTPHLSKLATEGVRYTNMYSTNGVCSPSRAAIALGLYPNRIGANHMRTGPWWSFNLSKSDMKRGERFRPEGIPAYEAMPPAGTHMHSHYLRAQGYYCTNNPKEDYQFRCEMTAWDESSSEAHWKNRKPGQSFFAIFNLGVTHESQIWQRSSDSLLVAKDKEIPIPPYLLNTENTKHDIRRMYSNIKLMDNQVGQIISELDSANLLDSTIIFWYTDHGGPLPRQKRTLFDSGLRAPMIIRFPHQQQAGTIDTQLLSFVDFKPTLLSIANIPIPSGLDGIAWLGAQKNKQSRNYIHAASDRFDREVDQIRAVRDQRFKYLRNAHPDIPHYKNLIYRLNMNCMKDLIEYRDKNQLTKLQQRWFDPKDGSEELYDTQSDPYEINNLIADQAYMNKIDELRKEMDRWLSSLEDKCSIPETELIQLNWPNGMQPKTHRPLIQITDKQKILLSTKTEGASIGYQWISEGEALSEAWNIYLDRPINKVNNKQLVVRAHRIGYLPSDFSFLKE